MSAHRQHAIPEQPPTNRWGMSPAQQRAELRATFGVAALVLAMMVCTAIAAAFGGPETVATPVRTPDVQVYALEPLDAPRLAAIRAESFQAGYNAALQDSCRPALTSPITAMRP